MVSGRIDRHRTHYTTVITTVFLLVFCAHAQFCQAADGNDKSAKEAAELVAQGRNQYHQNRYDEAMAAYQKAVRLKPDYADVYFEMGNTLYKKGKYEEAEASYSRAARLNSERPLLNSSLLYDDKERQSSHPPKQTQTANTRPHSTKRRPPRVNKKDDISNPNAGLQRSLRFNNNLQKGTRVLLQNPNRGNH